MESERAQLHASSVDARTRENVKLCAYGLLKRYAPDSKEACTCRKDKKC